MSGNGAETPLQTEKLKEHLALLEKRFSNNGQSKVQNSFQQPQINILMEEAAAARDQPLMVVSDFCEGQTDRNGKSINDEESSIQRYSQKGNRQEAQAKEEVSRELNQGEIKSEMNVWNGQRSNGENPIGFSYESNDFLAPEEKLSEGVSEKDITDPISVPSAGITKEGQNKGHNNSSASNQNRMSGENGQKLNQQCLSSPSVNNIQNINNSSLNNNKDSLNNLNNQLMGVGNSRDRGAKTTAKKRKTTTQTTLTMTKLRKSDTSQQQQQILPNQLPYQQQSLREQQQQMSNRPRLGSDSSNSNEQLLMNANPPPGNLKITNFFQNNCANKKTTTTAGNSSLNDQNNTNNNNKDQLVLAPLSNNNGTIVSKKNGNLDENNKNSSLLAASQSPPSASGIHQATLKGSGVSQMMLIDPKLELRYNCLTEDLKNKELQISEKASVIKYLEQDKIQLQKELTSVESEFNAYKTKAQKLLSCQLLDIEQHRREETRQYIAMEKYRLGEYVQTRDCTKFDETWQEGTEFKKIKDRLKAIELEKEELEKKKRSIKGCRKSTNETDTSADLVISEAKQRTNLQLQYLQKEEQDLLDLYKSLDHDKFLFVQKLKRFNDEKNSRYGQSWPILGERYQLLSLLGRGGFSEVYKAFDVEEFRYVACKIHQLNLNWSEQAKANYIKHAVRESKIHSELKHPNIVQLYDTVEIDNNSFATVLEFCEGLDLYFYLKKNKIIPEKEAKMLIKQILNALKYMNSQKTRIIHYDLKPQNIIFHKGELKISDFGLSKIFEDGQTRMELTSQGVGTYWYLPPETFVFDSNAQISPKVDIWSVGVIFFEMIFGQRPFGNNMSQDQILKDNVILKSTSVNFPAKPNVSSECKEFIKNCLTYDQNRRWDILKACDSQYISAKLK